MATTRISQRPRGDKDTRLGLMCLCASYFIPLIPHPILVLHGT